MQSQCLKILEKLCLQKSCTANELANYIHRSVRSVKTYVKQIQSEYPDLIVSSRLGYQILAEHKELARQLIGQPVTDDYNRMFRMAQWLLEHHSMACSIFDLADMFYISESSVQLELKKIKKYFLKFDVRLRQKQNFVEITGSEKNKRKIMSDLIYQQSDRQMVNKSLIQQLFSEVNVDEVDQVLTLSLKEYGFYLNDFAYANCLLHTIILLRRLIDFSFNGNNNEYGLFETIESKIAYQVISRLKELYGFNFSNDDVIEYSLLIASRGVPESQIEDILSLNQLELVHKIFAKIKQMYDIDLYSESLCVQFGLHLRNLIVRSQNNYFSKNPLTSEFKNNYPLIYEIAIFAAKVIEDELTITINEDEIAYIAFHIGTAIEESKERKNKLIVVIVCLNYYSMARQLALNIEATFGQQLFFEGLYTDYEQIKYKPVDFVISTLPNHSATIPWVTVSPFFTNADIQKIQQMIHQIAFEKQKQYFAQDLLQICHKEMFICIDKAMDKPQIIELMCNLMQNHEYVTHQYLGQVLEREQMSSTAFGAFAIPHSLQLSAKKTGLCILTSKQAIEWDEHQVYLVLMMAFNINERHVFHRLYEHLTRIISNQQNLKQLIQSSSFEEFVHILVDCF